MCSYDNLFVRQCKKNGLNLRNFRKIAALRSGRDLNRVTDSDVNSLLLQIVLKFELVRDWTDFVLVDLNPKKWFTKAQKTYEENLLEILVSKIACAPIDKFAGYRSPLYFRNRYKVKQILTSCTEPL